MSSFMWLRHLDLFTKVDDQHLKKSSSGGIGQFFFPFFFFFIFFLLSFLLLSFSILHFHFFIFFFSFQFFLPFSFSFPFSILFPFPFSFSSLISWIESELNLNWIWIATDFSFPHFFVLQWRCALCWCLLCFCWVSWRLLSLFRGYTLMKSIVLSLAHSTST